jgi:protein phosphatase
VASLSEISVIEVARKGGRELARLRAAKQSVGAVRRGQGRDATHVDVDRGLFIVADGADADAVRAVAIDAVARYLDAARPSINALVARPDGEAEAQIASWLAAAVRAAHHAVRDAAAGAPSGQITLDVVLVAGHHAFVAHVGDTRTYLLRGGMVLQLTRDHTMAEVMLFEGPRWAEGTDVRPVLVNAIGARPEVCVDVVYIPVQIGDQLLLCSDGLYQRVSVSEVAERLTWTDPQIGLLCLVELARMRGGGDDITAVAVDITGGLAGDDPLEPMSDGVPNATEDDDTEPSDVTALPFGAEMIAT